MMKLQCHVCGARWSIRRGDYNYNCPNGCDTQPAGNVPLTNPEAVDLALRLYEVGSKRDGARNG